MKNKTHINTHFPEKKKIRRAKEAITRKLQVKTVVEQVHISSSMLTTYI